MLKHPHGVKHEDILRSYAQILQPYRGVVFKDTAFARQSFGTRRHSLKNKWFLLRGYIAHLAYPNIPQHRNS